MGKLTRYQLGLSRIFSSQLEYRAKDFKEKIAKKSGTSVRYLNDLLKFRRIGSEEKRRLIAKSLGFSYEEVRFVGDPKNISKDFKELKRIINLTRKYKIIPDGIIENILVEWAILSQNEKNKVGKLCGQLYLNRIIGKENIESFLGNSEGRFHCIWESVFNEYGLNVHYSQSSFQLLKEYSAGEIGDLDVMEQARVQADLQLEHIGASDA